MVLLSRFLLLMDIQPVVLHPILDHVTSCTFSYIAYCLIRAADVTAIPQKFQRVMNGSQCMPMLLGAFFTAGAGAFDFYAYTLELSGTGVEKLAKKDAAVFPSAR